MQKELEAEVSGPGRFCGGRAGVELVKLGSGSRVVP